MIYHKIEKETTHEIATNGNQQDEQGNSALHLAQNGSSEEPPDRWDGEVIPNLYFQGPIETQEQYQQTVLRLFDMLLAQVKSLPLPKGLQAEAIENLFNRLHQLLYECQSYIQYEGYPNRGEVVENSLLTTSDSAPHVLTTLSLPLKVEVKVEDAMEGKERPQSQRPSLMHHDSFAKSEGLPILLDPANKSQDVMTGRKTIKVKKPLQKQQKCSQENLPLQMCNRILKVEKFDENNQKYNKRTIYLYLGSTNTLVAFWFDHKQKRFLPHPISEVDKKVILGKSSETDLTAMLNKGINGTHWHFSRITLRCNYNPHLFLTSVVRGKQKMEVLKLLQQDPELPFLKGDVIDLAGRQFKEITAAQYVAWALDIPMASAIFEWLPKKHKIEKALQLLDEFNKVSRDGVTYQLHGKTIKGETRYDFSVIEALKTYIDNYEQWSKKGSDLFLISLKNDEKLPDSILDKAKTLGTSVLVRKGKEFLIYGNKKGDGKYVPTKIEPTDDLNKLPFDQGIIHRQDKLFTPSLINILKKGHTPECEVGWRKVGEEQRKVPVHVVHLMCSPINLKDWKNKNNKGIVQSMTFFNQAKALRSEEVAEEWFVSKLGREFAIYHKNPSIPGKWSAYAVRVVEPFRAQEDWEGLTAQKKRILQDLEEFKSKLQEVSNKNQKGKHKKSVDPLRAKRRQEPVVLDTEDEVRISKKK
jgi:hypothetical protein